MSIIYSCGPCLGRIQCGINVLVHFQSIQCDGDSVWHVPCRGEMCCLCFLAKDRLLRECSQDVASTKKSRRVRVM